MNRDLLQKIVKSQKYQILSEIKRSQGLSVSELCRRVNLCYMGVKQHCIALEKDGYLDTWRRPKGMGRPEKAYRLTPRAQGFFPSEFTNLTCQILQSLSAVYGEAAPEKIMYQIFQTQAKYLEENMQGQSFEDKCRWMAMQRDKDGFMCEYYYNRDSLRHQLIEYHSPILPVIEAYPYVQQLEIRLLENVLQARVQRVEERVSGLYKCVFNLDPLSPDPIG